MTILYYMVYGAINDWTFEARMGPSFAPNAFEFVSLCVLCVFWFVVAIILMTSSTMKSVEEIWEWDRQHETLIHLFVSCIIASAAVEQLVKNSGPHLPLLYPPVSFACGNCVSFMGHHLPFTTNGRTHNDFPYTKYSLVVNLSSLPTSFVALSLWLFLYS